MALSKRNKILLLSGLLFVFFAVLSIYLVYNKPHLNIEKSKIDYQTEASDLLSEFEENSAIASQKYINKVIVVSGKISSIDITENATNILLAEKGDFFGVYCSFPTEKVESLRNLTVGETLKIKGVCTGFTDDVLLNNCTLN